MGERPLKSPLFHPSRVVWQSPCPPPVGLCPLSHLIYHSRSLLIPPDPYYWHIILENLYFGGGGLKSLNSATPLNTHGPLIYIIYFHTYWNTPNHIAYYPFLTLMSILLSFIFYTYQITQSLCTTPFYIQFKYYMGAKYKYFLFYTDH